MIADHLVPKALPRRLSEEDGEPHVVLGGTLKIDGSVYDYRNLISTLVDLGVYVHVYAVAHSAWLSVGRVLDPDSAEVRDAYAPLAEHPRARFETPVPQAEQVATLARYDAGSMQVAPRSHGPEVTPWIHMGYPSKYSYYFSAGLPLTVELGTLSSLRAHLGPPLLVEYTDAKDFTGKVRDPAFMAGRRRAVAERRHMFRLGHGLPRLLAFLERVVSAGRSCTALGPADTTPSGDAAAVETPVQSTADTG